MAGNWSGDGSARDGWVQRMLRLGVVGAGVVLMGWASIASIGCGARGQMNKSHASNAKVKMQGLKAATEYQMAEQALYAGDLEKARRHTNNSLSLNAEVARTFVLLGRVEMERGDVEASSAALDRAIELDAGNARAHYFRGVLNERIARADEAFAAYQKAAELDPTDPQYAIAAAEMLVDLGRATEARASLESRLSDFDHNPGIRQSLGQIALLEDRPADAVAILSEARLLAPDDPAIAEDLARAHLANNEPGSAEAILAALIERPAPKARTLREGKRAQDAEPLRRDLLHLRGRALLALDRAPEARAIYQQLTEDRAGAADVRAWIGLGESAAAVRDMARLRQASARVIALDPSNAEGYMLRAIFQRSRGDHQAAEASLVQSLTLEETSKGLILLGLVREDLGRPDAAAESYRRALAVDPDEDAARRLLDTIASRHDSANLGLPAGAPARPTAGVETGG